MAEVLALGMTHFPPLGWKDERMATFLKRMLNNPDLTEVERSPEGWPEEARRQWGEDEGKTAAAQHRKDLVDWMRKVRHALDEFNPDFVVIFGDDQYENFREDVIPPYCVCAYPEFEFLAHPPGHPEDVWGEGTDKKMVVPGAQGPARALASSLIEQGFDTAYAYKQLHEPLGHAFSNAISYLDYDRDKGFPYPIIPITINCYGRQIIARRGAAPKFGEVISAEDMDPPAPTPTRLFDLGAAIARHFRESPYRVALLASSGWSHAFLVGKNKLLFPDTEADRRMFDALEASDWDTWRNLTGDEVEDSGQQEMLNWSCLAGAMSELKQKPTQLGFLDTWIFNSTKVFLVAPPAIEGESSVEVAPETASARR